MIRLVVADDQELVRDGFCSILARQPDLQVVGQAGDGVEAVAVTARAQPDVVLLDVQMPVTDGLQAGRRILAASSPPRVLMLTTFDADEYVYEAMRFGASGFLLKDMRSGELVEADATAAASDRHAARLVFRKLSDPSADSAPLRMVPVKRPGCAKPQAADCTIPAREYA